MKKPRFTIDEMRLANVNARQICGLSRFLASIAPAEAQVIRDALADSSIQSAAINRVLTRHGWKYTEQVLTRHRRRGCVDCGMPCP